MIWTEQAWQWAACATADHEQQHLYGSQCSYSAGSRSCSQHTAGWLQQIWPQQLLDPPAHRGRRLSATSSQMLEAAEKCSDQLMKGKG